MVTKCLLGVDIGTYSSKGALVTEQGEVVGTTAVEHSLATPRAGWAEQDPDDIWWRDFLAISRSLLDHYTSPTMQVVGLGISTISPAIVPVDYEGNALRPAILYGIDTRATTQVEKLQRLTGATLSAQSAAPKVMWIRETEPEVWDRTHLVLNGSGYLNLRLTGAATIDVYDASVFAPFFDTQTLTWDERLAHVVAPVERMPAVTWTCDLAGTVTPQAARITGLPEGTPVITGTADAAAEAISTGLSQAGDMMMMVGSSTFFILKTPHALDSNAFWTSHFLEKDTYVVAGGTSTAGSLTRWFRDQFGATEMALERAGGENAYGALARMAAGSPRGARGLIALPYFAGERTPIHDPQARGVFFGLTLAHTRADLYRAVLESVGYAIRHNVDAMRGEGLAPKCILAVGGGSQNRLWMQIVSDIAGIALHIPEPQIGASYGDAFLAGVGARLFGGTAEASRWVRIGDRIEPDPAAHADYDNYYKIYRELYDRTAPLMGHLASLAR
jgi:xylulokinase